MSQKGVTPDEQFLLALYQLAHQAGDLFQCFDASIVGKSVSLKETAIKNIVKHLAQANFLKKEGERALKLTQHGCSFIEQYFFKK
ncbi:MAG: hypothetical protein K2X08_00595 [Chlamydiales bacterium]|nr:hypothetical protein [Chlamydiales bacterium]